MDYAIVLYMDDQKTKMAAQMTRELAAACGSDYCMKTIPHISIASLIAEDEEAVKAEAAKLSRLLKRGSSGYFLVSISAGRCFFIIKSLCQLRHYSHILRDLCVYAAAAAPIVTVTIRVSDAGRDRLSSWWCCRRTPSRLT